MKLPTILATGCVGCNMRIRDFEMTMTGMPGYMGLAEYAALPEPRPVFLLDGVEVNEQFLIAAVPGQQGYVLMNWNAGRGAVLCDCPTITFAVKRNLFRGKVEIVRPRDRKLIVPLPNLPPRSG